jgi:TrmH family RNA methyltransferase
LLSDIRIVLVATTHPGNIGAAARAMKNMGLADLALVNPKVFPSAEANARASGADDILQQAAVYPSVEAAIAGCHSVIGASARRRTISWPELTPRETAVRAAAAPMGQKTAILFGREHAGLTNEELLCCHHLLHIPCDAGFQSLNVAAAVQVVAYELRLAFLAGVEEAAGEEVQLASGEEMESFFGHLTATLFDVGFLHERKSSPSLIRRIRRIFNRAQLETTDINILRGILTAVQNRIRRTSTPC